MAKGQALVVGLGNIPNEISFQIPEVVLCFESYCLTMKFLLADIPIACILGTPFLAAVSPQICLENPTAFWSQKKHEVSLPYKDDY
jgi:hypothetical protein